MYSVKIGSSPIANWAESPDTRDRTGPIRTDGDHYYCVIMYHANCRAKTGHFRTLPDRTGHNRTVNLCYTVSCESRQASENWSPALFLCQISRKEKCRMNIMITTVYKTDFLPRIRSPDNRSVSTVQEQNPRSTTNKLKGMMWQWWSELYGLP